MKIRTDFVTNSSSSSFLTVKIQSKPSADLISAYKDCFEDSDGPAFTIKGDTIALSDEVTFDSELHCFDKILDALVAVLAVGYYDSSPCDAREYFEDEHPEGLQLLQQIEERKNELLASIESAVWDTGNCGDGGDSYARFNHSYSDEVIRKCLKLGKNAEIDGNIREKFETYLAEASSNEMTEFRYEKGSLPTIRTIYELNGITLSDETEVVSLSKNLPEYTMVVGTQYEGREDRIKCLKDGDPLELVREPKNPHDKNAISVISKQGQIGYISSALAQDLAPLIDSKAFNCSATLESVTSVTSSESKQYLRVMIQIAYKPAK